MRLGRKTRPADDFIEIASKLPWWLALLLSVISYFARHAFASQPITGASSPAQMTKFILLVVKKGLTTAGQYILPILFGKATVMSWVQQRKHTSIPQVVPSFNTQKHQVNASISHGCPLCSSNMVLQDAKRGVNPGKSFWGCTQFLRCKCTRVAS